MANLLANLKAKYKEINYLLLFISFKEKDKGEKIEQEQFEEILNKKLEDSKNKLPDYDRNEYQIFFDLMSQEFDLAEDKLNQFFSKDDFLKQFDRKIDDKLIKSKEEGEKVSIMQCIGEDEIKKNLSLYKVLALANPKDNLKYMPPSYLDTKIEKLNQIFYKEIFLAKNGETSLLSWLPKDGLTFDRCLFAIENDGSSFQCLPEKIKKDSNKYFRLCKMVLANHGSALKSIVLEEPLVEKPLLSKAQYTELCELAIKNTPSALRYVNLNYIKNKENYFNFCELAIQKDPNSILDVNYDAVGPEKYKKLYIFLVEQHPRKGLLFAKEYIFNSESAEKETSEKEFLSICEIALEKDISLSKLIASQVKTVEKLPEIIANLIKKDPHKINLISEFILTEIWPQFDLEFKKKLLIENFSNIKYFSSQETKEKLEAFKNQITMTTKKVTILVVDDSAMADQEVKIAREIYKNKHTRKNEQVFCVNRYDLQEVLGLLEKNTPNKEMKLVLLDHGTKNMSTCCGLTPNEISDCIKEHPLISKIILLACHSAFGAKVTKEEREHIKEYLSQNKFFNFESHMDKNAPTERNIRTSDPSDLGNTSFLAQLYKAIVDKNPEMHRIEIKACPRILSPDHAQNKFHSTYKGIAGKDLSINQEKLSEEYKKRYNENLKKISIEKIEEENEVSTEGKYITIITSVLPKS